MGIMTNLELAKKHEEVAKKYKLSKYMKGQLHIAYCLGCSPATKRKENDN